MAEPHLKLEDVQDRPLVDLLREIADRQVGVAVRLPDGREVVIQPRALLRPLPTLEGRVPPAWKDALYAQG